MSPDPASMIQKTNERAWSSVTMSLTKELMTDSTTNSRKVNCGIGRSSQLEPSALAEVRFQIHEQIAAPLDPQALKVVFTHRLTDMSNAATAPSGAFTFNPTEGVKTQEGTPLPCSSFYCKEDITHGHKYYTQVYSNGDAAHFHHDHKGETLFYRGPAHKIALLGIPN